jgi:hypothetical protein
MDPSQLSSPPSENGSGVFLWFDWQELSRFGHHAYGRFIYEKLLPLFRIRVYSLEDLVMPAGRYGFYDGDVMGWPEEQLIARDEAEAEVLDRVRSDTGTIYSVAVFSSDAAVFSPLDGRLRNMLGYVGMTTCPSISRRGFDDLTGDMALVYAFSLVYEQIMPESFSFFTKQALDAMGFLLRETKG